MSMGSLSISSLVLWFNKWEDKKAGNSSSEAQQICQYLFDQYVSFQMTKESLSCSSPLVLAKVLMSLENQLPFGPGWSETTEKRGSEHVGEGGWEKWEGPEEHCPPHECSAETGSCAGRAQTKEASFSQKGWMLDHQEDKLCLQRLPLQRNHVSLTTHRTFLSSDFTWANAWGVDKPESCRKSTLQWLIALPQILFSLETSLGIAAFSTCFSAD